MAPFFGRLPGRKANFFSFERRFNRSSTDDQFGYLKHLSVILREEIDRDLMWTRVRAWANTKLIAETTCVCRRRHYIARLVRLYHRDNNVPVASVRSDCRHLCRHQRAKLSNLSLCMNVNCRISIRSHRAIYLNGLCSVTLVRKSPENEVARRKPDRVSFPPIRTT